MLVPGLRAQTTYSGSAGAAAMFKRICQGLTALLAVALVASPASAAQQGNVTGSPATATGNRAAPHASTRKIALGVSMLPFADQNTYDSFTAATGRPPAVWSIWADWADSTSAFPTALVNRLKQGHSVPLIIWQPVGAGKPPGHSGSPGLEESCGVDYSKIIGGDWDTYIRSWATAAIGKGPILMRFAHEMDGGWFPFGFTRCQNSAAKFKTMWKHVVTIFRSAGATNVKFVWSPLKANTHAKQLYPGNAWVDYVGVSSFNWASAHHAPWQSLVTVVKHFTDGLMSYASSKPWILAETGSVPSEHGHSRASWLTSGYKALYSQIPNIKAIVYFNIDMRSISDQPNWTLTPGADINAYKSLLQNSHFQGKVS